MNTSNVTNYKTKIREVYCSVKELQDGNITNNKTNR